MRKPRRCCVPDSLRTWPLQCAAYGVNEKGDQILATFTLSEVPDPAWLRFFKEHLAYSGFDYTTAAICGTRLQVELPERGALSSLVESVEGIIRAANLDYEFHGP